MDMDKVSLGAAWDEALGFCKAEAALLAPLALLGFGLPLAVLELVMPEKVVIDGTIITGPWMLWLLPHMLFSLLGTLSISALTARTGISVREALVVGLRRMPAGIAVALVAIGALVLASVPVGIVAGVEASVAGKPGTVFLLAYLVVLVLLGWLSLRLLPVWAALAAGRANGWTTLRETIRQTRGYAPMLLLLRLVSWTSQFIVMTVIMLPTRAVLALIGRATGAGEFTDLVAMLVGAALAAAVVALWTVYVAALQRRFAALGGGPSNGT